MKKHINKLKSKLSSDRFHTLVQSACVIAIGVMVVIFLNDAFRSNPHKAELNFVEKSAFGSGSVMPASCNGSPVDTHGGAYNCSCPTNQYAYARSETSVACDWVTLGCPYGAGGSYYFPNGTGGCPVPCPSGYSGTYIYNNGPWWSCTANCPSGYSIVRSLPYGGSAGGRLYYSSYYYYTEGISACSAQVSCDYGNSSEMRSSGGSEFGAGAVWYELAWNYGQTPKSCFTCSSSVTATTQSLCPNTPPSVFVR